MIPPEVILFSTGLVGGTAFALAYNRVRDRLRSKRIAKAVRRYQTAEKLRDAYRSHQGCGASFNCGSPTCPRAQKTVNVQVTLTADAAEFAASMREPRGRINAITSPRPVRAKKCSFLGCDGRHLEVGPR